MPRISGRLFKTMGDGCSSNSRPSSAAVNAPCDAEQMAADNGRALEAKHAFSTLGRPLGAVLSKARDPWRRRNHHLPLRASRTPAAGNFRRGLRACAAGGRGRSHSTSERRASRNFTRTGHVYAVRIEPMVLARGLNRPSSTSSASALHRRASVRQLSARHGQGPSSMACDSLTTDLCGSGAHSSCAETPR